MTNTLYFGDNLDILREHIADGSVDLVYLDPPFNSRANYNVLFKSPADDAESAQAEAFRDTWTWGEEAERAFSETMKAGGGTARIIDALRSALGDDDMMAYLTMMAVRLIEMRRVLRSSGSLYLHCDPTASHYLKVLLDGVFKARNFRTEIVWKRSSAHSDTKQGRKQHGRIHDVIFFYSKSNDWTWNPIFTPYDRGYIDTFYRHEEPGTGRRYGLGDLTGPGGASRGNPRYEVMGVTGHWRYTERKMAALIAEGRVVQNRPGGTPRFKRYLDEMPGVSLQDIWPDIKPVGAQARERLGYPTQKPRALLERIIRSSSNGGDVVLDPFCGCGTGVHAAQELGRRWIGIDIAIHAVKVIKARLETCAGGGPEYSVEGMPRDFESALRLAERDKYQFQWWANYLFNPHALREQRKGADKGIDGEMFFPNGPGRAWGRMLTSVKGGSAVGPAAIRDFRGALERENAEMGLFICLRPPTKSMAVEAVSAGLADTVHGELLRLQIVAMEEWFAGKLPKLPPLEHLPSAAFASTKRRVKAKPRRPDPDRPEFRYTFHGTDDADTVVHFNPTMVGGKVGRLTG